MMQIYAISMTSSPIFNRLEGLLGGYLSNNPLIIELTNIYWIATMTRVPATTLEGACVMIKVVDFDTT